MSKTSKRAIAWVAVALLVLGAVAIGLRGCTLMPWNNETSGEENVVSLYVTRDFGRQLIESAEVSFRSGDSVMDILARIVDVKTEYGGGFVSAIEGLESTTGAGERMDWFYYLNGALLDVGADDCEVENGDFIWWDYHRWSDSNFIGAVVGAYPRPFIGGYPKERTQTEVVYSGYLESLAREIGLFLAERGATVKSSQELSTFVPDRSDGPSMVVVTYEEALETDWVMELVRESRRTGVSLDLEGDQIVPLDSSGEPSPVDEEVVCAVVASASGIGDPCPTWLVICKGESGALQAGVVLTREPSPIELEIGTVIGSSGKLYSLPR